MFFWVKCERGESRVKIGGVGLMVAEKWIEEVRDVKRVSSRIIVVRVKVGKTVLNLISIYICSISW